MYGILDVQDQISDTGDDELLLNVFVAPLKVDSKRLTTLSDTLSLKRKYSIGAAQRWEIEAGGISSDERQADLFVHNILNGDGQVVYVRPPAMVKGYNTDGVQRLTGGDFTLPDPTNRGLAVSKGIAQATQAVSSSVTSIEISMTIGSEVFKGDFVRFESHSKVYMITEVIPNIDPGTNLVTIEFYPALLTSVAISDFAYLGVNATMKMSYDVETMTGMSYMDGILEDLGTIRLVEEI